MYRFLLNSLTWSVLVTAATVAIAQEDPEAVIKYRQGVMKAQGGHMAAMAQIVRGKVDYADQLKVHAQALNSIADNIDALFPEGSDFGETEAKAEIWDNWDKFKESANNASQKAQTFLKTVESGSKEDIGKQFKELGQACKSCHKKFRTEKE